eukprot:19334-Heterococcus_DN1.PRE.2
MTQFKVDGATSVPTAVHVNNRSQRDVMTTALYDLVDSRVQQVAVYKRREEFEVPVSHKHTDTTQRVYSKEQHNVSLRR